MWDNPIFEVSFVEFGGQWISLCGTHIPSFFNCTIVGVYAASLVKERADLWEEITTLKFAFDLSLVLLGDFNETLHAYERSSGHLNLSGLTSFRRFISDCELVEFNMQGHRFTWFRGGSMSCIDRAFLPWIFSCSSRLYLFAATLEGCPIIVSCSSKALR